MIWKHGYHFSLTAGERRHRKSGFLHEKRQNDRFPYRLIGLTNTKAIQIELGQSLRRNSATWDPLRSTSMSESYLIRVNYALKFTDKTEINKMFITVNTAAKKRTIVSFTLGRSGISCRKSIFVWWLRQNTLIPPVWEWNVLCHLEKYRKCQLLI